MKLKRRVLAILLSVIMVIGAFPFAVSAEDNTVTLNYIDIDGSLKTAENVTVIDAFTFEMESGWYAVTADVTVDYRIICTGEINLILADGCTLTAVRGVSVNDENNTSLTVYGQQSGSGKLVTENVTAYSAGIGGDDTYSSGQITINGGTFDVVGGNCGAGIGGGYNGNGNVTINKGIVVARGGNGGAGIGGGNKRFGYDNINGYVTVNGGRVTAKGGNSAAGIGGRCEGIVNINGGIVEANSGSNAAAIGGGNAYKGTVVITGGTVEANGNSYAASIGGGRSGSGDVTITGGTVTAQYGNYGLGGGDITATDSSVIHLSWDSRNNSIYTSGINGNLYLDKGFTDGTNDYPNSLYTDTSDFDNVTLTPLLGQLYNIIIDITGNGTLTPTPIKAYAGEKVVLNASPADGYHLVSIGVTGPNGMPIAVVNNSFTMPSGNVTVAATFDLGVYTDYLDLNGEIQQVIATKITSSATAMSNGWYFVKDNVSIPNNVRITLSGNVNLILGDGATLTVPYGIGTVNAGASLTIWSQSEATGTLIAGSTSTGANDYNSGIGSDYSGNPVAVTVNGGNVTAYGGQYGAGIGGGWMSSGNVTVNGGVINAIGGQYGAGIGGGPQASDKTTVVINGGTVTAGASGGAAAIGGGYMSSAEVTVNDGKITATSEDTASSSNGGGAGIGGGTQAAGKVTVNGGSITATASLFAAGIGGGFKAAGDVIINGGAVKAYGGGFDNNHGCGAGIGGGAEANAQTTVEINDGNIYAFGGNYTASIGAGCDSSADVTVNGGIVRTEYKYEDLNQGIPERIGIGGSSSSDESTSNIYLTYTEYAYIEGSYHGKVTLGNTFKDDDGNIYQSGSFDYTDSRFTNTLCPPSCGKVTYNSLGHGTVNVFRNNLYYYGETVSISETPESGYTLDYVTAVDADGNEIPVSNNKFIMPMKNVTVTLAFRELLDINEDGVEDINDIAFIISACVGEAEMTASQSAKADLNGDGIVDAFDAAWLDRYFYSPEAQDGDVNQDGTFDLVDYALVKAHISGVDSDEDHPADLLDKSYLGTEYSYFKDSYDDGVIITPVYYNADINKDKAVDAFDLFYLDKRINGLA